MPKLYDLHPAIHRIQHRTKETVDRNLVSGFFEHLSPGCSKRVLTWIELALWQDPGFVPSQSHDCDTRPGAFPKDNSARSQDRRAGLHRITHVNASPTNARRASDRSHSVSRCMAFPLILCAAHTRVLMLNARLTRVVARCAPRRVRAHGRAGAPRYRLQLIACAL